ncbi:uncharacterized protein CELE_Y69A2AR.46 [Caenorhabditis elegans]|uniref:Uncharacterized protein n=1 Tax=Caenorhabditis elegans TaxID=6239 RepID=U4PMU9_CAEEL|nr:Uncharacterized protein CELE_Y69A2AR.46 [Caenorhabditis elegans]CDH93419.1 Uncharacterized protein CELE_Y69A2AR.46 [Caenorhabditis elegans]|eukprot:NP_001294615.1 Uncharacterized protein CELE_Y69A2AR.46 [Caenorhabditis elegans]
MTSTESMSTMLTIFISTKVNRGYKSVEEWKQEK